MTRRPTPRPHPAPLPDDLDEAVPTLDDARYPDRRPSSTASGLVFDVDPEDADAAQDLAYDLGAEFLESAKLGEDLGDHERLLEEREESELPFLIDEELSDDDERPSRPRGARDRSRGP